MTARRQGHRGHRRDALFDFRPGGDTAPAEARDNPLLRACSWCGAGVGQPCTRQAPGGGRVQVDPHDARRQLAASTTTTTEESTDGR